MIMTNKTFANIIRILKGCYPNWNIGVDTVVFMNNWKELIPEELADDMVRVYRKCRTKGPESAVDFLNAYVEYQIKQAKSAEEVITEIVDGIHTYDGDYDLQYEELDDYLMRTVIFALPCPNGVSAFYFSNKSNLIHLARYAPEHYEEIAIRKKLERSYHDKLIIVEKSAVKEKLACTTLAAGTDQSNKLLGE